MTTIYLAMLSDLSYTQVLGVYSTKAKAEAVVRKERKGERYPDTYFVEEMELDE